MGPGPAKFNDPSVKRRPRVHRSKVTQQTELNEGVVTPDTFDGANILD